MEAFYDGDLKDIWDSDLDPSDTLKLSSDSDMHDWFLERDVKIPAVILNDKLISDALLGTLPIKSEHSYSLNSDGDSIPNSPRSLRTKMDDMEDECYPAISMKTVTSNIRLSAMDTSCSSAVNCSSSPTTLAAVTSAKSNPMLTSVLHNSPPSTLSSTTSELSKSSSSLFTGINKMATSPQTINLRSLNSTFTLKQQQQQQQLIQQMQLQQQQQQQQEQKDQQLKLREHQQQQHQHALTLATYHSNSISSREGSISPDICSDIEIDESCIKDEPMSPDSSCPPSPNSHIYASSACSSQSSVGGSCLGADSGGGSFSLNMANVAAFTNSDLVFEHKNGSLQLTPASQSLLKSQQFILGTAGQSIVIPKVNIKVEQQIRGVVSTGPSTNGAVTTSQQSNGGGTIFSLPPTPPSSLPSDESEGNQSPEHTLSPMSPPTSIVAPGAAAHQLVRASGSGSSCSITVAPSSVTARRSTVSSSSSNSSNSPVSSHHHGNVSNSGRVYTGSSTRQPIHTPLISSQPKGSTGNLLLTEEEKRTLLAEGYPIPTRLPLTKAEEKSLKKIRRKIKNKISAQESRRKKKEYMDQLERKVEILVSENIDYKKRVENLEDSNSNLLSQLQKLQALVNKQQRKA